MDQTSYHPSPLFPAEDTIAQRTEVISPRSHSIHRRGKIFLFFKVLSIYWRGRESMSRGRKRSRPSAEQGAQPGTRYQDPESVTSAEGRHLNG